MATIVTRSGKGSPLTNTEVDANFTNLNTDKAELSGATFTGEIVAPSLDISGNIDVDGTTNLDVVDIDGAVDMASTLAVAGAITANAGVVVDNITIDGNEIDLSSGNFVLDVAGEIELDSDGGKWIFLDGGTQVGRIENSSSDFVIKSSVNDKDIKFNGEDGGSNITALTLDMSAGGTAYFADDVRLTDNHAVRLGNDADIVFYHDNSNGYLENGTGNLTLDVAGDIILDAGGTEIKLKTNGTEYGQIFNSSNNLAIYSSVSNADIRFHGNDGGSFVTALTLDMSNAGKATFNSGADFGADTQVTGVMSLYSSAIGAVIGSIGNTANDLNIYSTTSGHNGLRFHVNGILPTDNGGTIIDNDADLGDTSYRFKDLHLSGSIKNTSDITLDAAGDIILDADGGDVRFKDGGTEFLQIFNNSTNAHIYNANQDKDILIQGNDGGSTVTAVQFDMSAAGAATFNAGATFGAAINAGGTITGDDGLNIDGGTGNAYISVGSNTGSWVWKNYQATHKLALEDSDGTGEVLNFSTTGAATFSYSVRGAQLEAYKTNHGGDVSVAANQVGNAYENLASTASLILGATSTSTVNSSKIVSDHTAASGGGTGNHTQGLSFHPVGANSQNFEAMRLNYNEMVVNQNSLDYDFRVESNNNANMLYVDGGNNAVGIGGATISGSSTVLQVNGDMRVENSAVLTGRESASAPSHSFHDDSDTGMFNINPNILGFSTAGGERMRIESDGAVVLKPNGITTGLRLQGRSSDNNFFIQWNNNNGSTNYGSIGSVSATPGLQYSADDHKFVNQATNSPFMQMNSSGTVFNEGGADRDFRVESDNNSHALFVDAGNNNVLLGKASLNVGVAGVEFRGASSNYFTTSGDTVLGLNRLSNDGPVLELRKDSSVIGNLAVSSGAYLSVRSNGGNLRLGANNTDYWSIDEYRIYPLTDAVDDLGLANNRVKDLYLSGGVFLGGTGAANKLDDYEEGTWTPADGAGGVGSGGYGVYTKIGRLVHVSGTLVVTAFTGGNTDYAISGLPFTVSNASGARGITNLAASPAAQTPSAGTCDAGGTTMYLRPSSAYSGAAISIYFSATYMT